MCRYSSCERYCSHHVTAGLERGSGIQISVPCPTHRSEPTLLSFHTDGYNTWTPWVPLNPMPEPPRRLQAKNCVWGLLVPGQRRKRLIHSARRHPIRIVSRIAPYQENTPFGNVGTTQCEIQTVTAPRPLNRCSGGSCRQASAVND